MDGHDKFPEERVGTVAMMRQRAAEIEAVAEACDAEADEQAQAVIRLRTRSTSLRHLAEEYVTAAHMAEAQRQSRFEPTDPTRPVGVFIVPNDTIPDQARPGDIVMVQDPVDPSTFRRYRWNEDRREWVRSRT